MENLSGGLGGLDYTVVAVYALILVGLAWFVSREKVGHEKNTEDYFLAGKSLPWWAIGASLIAANISAEQVIGMSGSGFVVGLAIASYEWMAAITLVIVAKFFIPIFLERKIYTMPQFLESRFGPSVKYVMSVFWIILYTVVNLTTIMWLGATAIETLTGLPKFQGMLALGAFAALYSLYGGLKAVAFTDIIQVVLLVFGGVLITWIALGKIGVDGSVMNGFSTLMAEMPEKFDMILDRDNPEYKNLPGIGVILGSMWVMNVSYWGFNQYIIQRALGAKNLQEAQKGIMFAAFLKMIVPFIIVIPGIAAAHMIANGMAPPIDKPDQAYPTMMALAPTGIKGLIFAALIAAIVSSVGSMMNSISTIFTMDLMKPLFMKDASEKKLVNVGRIASSAALVIALFLATPLLGSADQVFQKIQNWTGLVTPGICAIFILGMFWKRTTEMGGLAAVVSSVFLSGIWPQIFPNMPFMDRVGIVFLLALLIGALVSYLQPQQGEDKIVDLNGINFKTSTGFNISAVIIIVMLFAVYGYWW